MAEAPTLAALDAALDAARDQIRASEHHPTGMWLSYSTAEALGIDLTDIEDWDVDADA